MGAGTSAVLEAARRLRVALSGARLDVPYLYDPLAYAWAPHEAYLRRTATRPTGCSSSG